MDTLAPMNTAAAAPAASAPPSGSSPGTGRPAAPRPGRSFAATLAGARPGVAHGRASADAAGAATEPATHAGAPPVDDSAPKATKAPARPAARPKAASGGDGPPVDGNALPLWLPPLVPASAQPGATDATDAAGARAPADLTAPGTADTLAVALQGRDRPAGLSVLAGPAEEPAAAAGQVELAAGAANPSTDASVRAAPPAAAVAKTAGAADEVEARQPDTRTSGDTARPDAAPVADPTPLAATLSPAIVAPAMPLPATPADVPAPAPAVGTAADARPARRPVIAAGGGPAAAPAADAAPSLPPVAPGLEHAVTAMRPTDAQGELATATAAKAALDAGVAALAQAAGPAGARAATPAVAQVSTPVGAPAWAHELADRISVLVNQNLTHAQIKLAPADLGPIEVRIALADGQANVSFTTHSHLTSEALQAAAPRLREALHAQGYGSVNVDVAQQQFRERAPQQARYEPEPVFAAVAAKGGGREATRATPGTGAALRLDAYA